VPRRSELPEPRTEASRPQPQAARTPNLSGRGEGGRVSWWTCKWGVG
jgi:hypothetical protein